MSVTGMVISGSKTEFRNGNTDVLMVFGSSVVKGMLVPTVNVCVGLPAPCARAPETSNNDAPNKAEPPPINCRRVSRTRPIGHSLRTFHCIFWNVPEFVRSAAERRTNVKE